MGKDEPIKMFRSEFCFFMIGREICGRQGGNAAASLRCSCHGGKRWYKDTSLDQTWTGQEVTAPSTG